ncbi:MAG: DNA repair protein RecN [Clostridiales bacterium]|nr:DNA repair protein RecN [Clostridiales bacterium]
MLQKLIINNIAVIENAQIEFEKGLNILTGETGSGKSIIIDSINAVIGERTSKEIIRSGCHEGKVFALFSCVGENVLRFIADKGIPLNDDDTVTVARTINASGKNNCRINSFPVSVSTLKEIGFELINIHGQHDSQALLRSETHCSFIDSLAGNELLRNEYKEALRSLIKTKKELYSLYDIRDEKSKKLDYLLFSVDEIKNADIKPGESEKLNKEKTILENSRKIISSLSEVRDTLKKDDGVIDALQLSAAVLTKLSAVMDECESFNEIILNSVTELSGVTSAIDTLIENIDYSTERLFQINERLDFLYSLFYKYGSDEKAVLEYYNGALEEIETLNNTDGSISLLENRMYDLSSKVKDLSSKLTLNRKESAEKFAHSVCAELKALDMPDAAFEVIFKSIPLNSNGGDDVEFYININPGQELKPLCKTASGGELSRIMLAIKNVLSKTDPVSTLIFDEIDTGVSGSAAGKIADKLHMLSQDKQVICVTHLALIAAKADVHFNISKTVENNCAKTNVKKLDRSERIAEIARINVGGDISETHLKSAEEMLFNSHQI